MTATIRKTGNVLWPIATETDFDQDYVDLVKLMVPARQRKWDSENRVWLFKEPAVDLVCSLLERVYGSYTWSTPTPAPDPVPTLASAYEALWLRPGAPAELAHHVFKWLAKQHHPDVGGDTAAMQRLNAAFSVIEKGG